MRALPYSTPEEMAGSARVMVGAMLGLLSLGIVMAYSSTMVEQFRIHGVESVTRPLAGHLVKVGCALIVFLFALHVRPKQLYTAAWPAWGGSLVLLGAVLLLGDVTNNARRWFDVAGTSFQPSEVARVATIAVLAAWMATARDRVHSARVGVVVPFALAAVPAGLIFLEPDYGSSVYLLFMAVLVMWVGGARSQHLLAAFLPTLAVASIAGWMLFAHFRTRILGFLSPEPDWQVAQGLVALGSGGVTGAGLGAGLGKWGLLPEAENDFLLAVVGEELGLVGTALIVLLYVLFLWHGVRLLLGLRTRFSLILGAGLLMQVLVQAVLNIAVVTASAPNKGLPLPFVSAGGTSLLVLCGSTGLLLGLARRPEEDPVLEARLAASLTHRGEPGA